MAQNNLELKIVGEMLFLNYWDSQNGKDRILGIDVKGRAFDDSADNPKPVDITEWLRETARAIYRESK